MKKCLVVVFIILFCAGLVYGRPVSHKNVRASKKTASPAKTQKTPGVSTLAAPRSSIKLRFECACRQISRGVRRQSQ